jgi:hyaluronate lyase
MKKYVICLFLGMSLPVFGQTADEMTVLRTRWQEMLTGGDWLDTSDPLVASYIRDVDERAGQIWNSLIKKPTSGTDSRTRLFSDLPITTRDRTGSSQITLTYDRLRSLALAYKMPATTFTGRADVLTELIAALDMMVSKHYSLAQSTNGTGTSANGGSYGNWYDWRIGTPLRYGDLLMIISDELSTEQMTTYVAPILSNNKAVDNTGANRAWIAGIVAQAGVLKGDAAQIATAKAGLQTIFRYVITGDGYYVDGSFVQHTNYAYTGGYGKALLATIAPLMYVLEGSTWEIAYTDQIQQNFYDMIFEAYEPLIYDGRFMDMVREREISRVANQDHVPGRQAIRAIVLLLDVMPEAQKARAESMLKEWLQDEVVMKQVCSDPLEGYLEYYLPPFVIAKAQALLQDETIAPRGKLITHKTFASMDRVVHLQENYAFGLSMTSNRIKNTEGTNDEGLRLWHIGDGMTYLYNEDKDLFADHFWATVDYQRLPGTTVARVSRGTKDSYGTFNPNAWVGGADLDAFGVAGMEFTGMGATATRNLQAKKSWFMFDDEIVALGSNIKLVSGSAPVETTIENRRIKADLSNKLAVNGTEKGADFTGIHTDVEWIHLEGNQGIHTDAGYYFPHKVSIEGKRETRNGAWNLVNTYAKYVDTTPRQNNFITFWLNHGNTPQNESYAYVLLPGKSAEETAVYNENPDIEILQQDDALHAVREKTQGITAINFWKAGTFGPYTVSQPAALLVRENGDNTLDVAVSNPSRSAATLSLTFDPSVISIQEAIELDNKVSFQEANNGLLINTSGAYGKTFHATLRKSSTNSMVEIDAGDPVVATESYNLMGQKIEKPSVSGIYLIKKTLKSKKTIVMKNRVTL